MAEEEELVRLLVIVTLMLAKKADYSEAVEEVTQLLQQVIVVELLMER